MSPADLEPDHDVARFLSLCAADRYAEAEPVVTSVYRDGSEPDGSELRARGAFYEEWGDAVASGDPAEAATAWAQAEELYVQFASFVAGGAEGAARWADVERVRGKQRDRRARAVD